MKIVKLSGGLGNQMFQYAFGQALGNETVYESSWFEKTKGNSDITQRSFELNFFKCTPHILEPNDFKKLKKNNKFLILFGIKTKHKKITEKPFNVYNPKLLKITKGIFEGYFQCAQYYDSVREQLLKDFTPRAKINEDNQKILELIQKTNSVSLHVRRGDYLKLQHIHGLCDISYYEKAIDYIALHTVNPHFFLFSDDIKWVKENLKINHPFTVVNINSGKNSPWDMWLMKNCKHNIIANSSFSWWGAWLNENPQKIVIAPQKWTTSNTSTDIIPHEWKRI